MRLVWFLLKVFRRSHLEEELIKLDDRVFLEVAVPEFPDDSLHVGLVEKLHDLANTKLVEVDARTATRVLGLIQNS